MPYRLAMPLCFILFCHGSAPSTCVSISNHSTFVNRFFEFFYNFFSLLKITSLPFFRIRAKAQFSKPVFLHFIVIKAKLFRHFVDFYLNLRKKIYQFERIYCAFSLDTKVFAVYNINMNTEHIIHFCKSNLCGKLLF